VYDVVSFDYTLQGSQPSGVIDAPFDKEEMRGKILQAQEEISKLPNARFNDDCAPLRHTFADGSYIREITMPKGMVIASKIHKVEHPFFVMKGDCTVVSDDKIQRIKAPYWGITKPGTKRILYIHEETVWATVHVTDSQDLEEIEHQIIAKSYAEIPLSEETKCLGE